MKYFALPAALLCTALVAACGGGGDDAPAAVAAAKDDAANIAWNSSASIAVLANDTVQNGSASVVIASAPGHGTATVEGSTIRYTPASGYFGTDTFRYALTVGGQTAQAAVQITVVAELTLSGSVHDAPLPSAKVVATVGNTVLPTVTADASGNFQVKFQTSDPAAFISLKATGSGTRSTVVLTSLVGDTYQAAAAATAGTAAAAALPTVDVTHVSTAIAVLAQQALGKAVASSAELAATQGKFSVTQIIEMATAIKLLADLDARLPAGSADTLALVSDAAALRSFVAAQVALDAGASFNQVQQTVLADPLLGVKLPTPAAGAAPLTLTLVQGEGAASSFATRVILQAGGVARVESDVVDSATWSAKGAEVTITLDKANTYTSYSFDIDPQTGQQNLVQYRDTGFVVRQLGGTPGTGPASVKLLSSFVYLDGSRKGQVVTADSDWDAQTLVGGIGSFAATDFTPGTRWAGVVTGSVAAGAAGLLDQDILNVLDATTVIFERTQQRGSFRLTGGKLELTFGTSVYFVSRLFTGPLGEERWLIEKSVAGATATVYGAAAFKAQSVAAFTASGLSKRWKSYINAGATANEFFIELSANGSGRQISIPVGDAAQTTRDGTWSIGTDGQMTLTRLTCQFAASCTSSSQRTWQLLGTVGNRIYVLERLRITSNGAATYDQYRVNVYTATN